VGVLAFGDTLQFIAAKASQLIFEMGASMAQFVNRIPGLGGALELQIAEQRAAAEVFKNAADELNIPIVWGGDWKSFKDGPHYELPWKHYR
jgi:hypothetical protein